MNDRYEHITERLVAIEEELRDLAYDSLREVARSPDSEDAAVVAKQEKRLLQARRAVAKAIGALAPTAADD